MALCILFLALFSLCCKSNASSQPGRVGLWSDSGCNSKSGDTSNFDEPDPINLNFTLTPDVCGVPSATVHSYRVLQSATCANGTTAIFDYYNRNNCTADPTDEDPNPGLTRRMKNRRQSNSVLDGVTPRDFKVNSLSTSTSSSKIPVTSSMLASVSSSNRSATATNSAANVSATTGSPTTSTLGSKSHLSAGTSAGIGVGSAVGVLGFAALLFFFSRRYKVVKIEDSDRHSEPGSAHPAMTSSSGATPQMIYETGVGQPHEVGGVAVNPIYEAGMGNEILEIANPRTSFGQ